ncbi:MAG: hypothetical protein U0031_00530 [Thermomicrobiales bacterium]
MDPNPAMVMSVAAAAERTAVEAALRRRDLTPQVRERLEMVKAAALGHDWRRSRPGAGAPRGRCGTGWRGSGAAASPPPMRRARVGRPKADAAAWRRSPRR